tara:strand:- start:15236 stop:15931 length:696 start_codon:yes stop_codon:yes gene_type:complete
MSDERRTNEWEAIEARMRASFQPPADPARTVRRLWSRDEGRHSAWWSLAGVAAAAVLIVSTMTTRPGSSPGPTLDDLYVSFLSSPDLCSEIPTFGPDVLALDDVGTFSCSLQPQGPRTFGDVPVGVVHDARYAVEGPLEGLPWRGTRALRLVGPEGEAFVLTHPPATAVGQGVRGSGVRMHTCQIDGVPVVQLSAPGVPNLLHLIVPLGSRGLPRLVPPPEQDLRPLGTDF